ncbi:MAG: glycosyltransferase family 2 protein [Calditrichaceae bacterium]
MSDKGVAIVLHYSEPQDIFLKLLQTVFGQTNTDFEVMIIGTERNEAIKQKVSEINTETFPVKYYFLGDSSYSDSLHKVFKQADTPFILYIDNKKKPVFLKNGAVDLFLSAAKRNKNAGLIYSDYELEENGQVKEIHLLKHHFGRVRYNQDYGKVYFFRNRVLQEIGYTYKTLRYNTLYDLRLKISENFELIHIASRYAGSAYRIAAKSQNHNVFDYLMASKEIQLEAEMVLTEHLKRIGSYLAPGEHCVPRPAPSAEATLKASVIIPVNNRPEFISAAIESVQNQTVKEIEVITVVNGGTSDPTIAQVRRHMPGGDRYDESLPEVVLLVYDINNIGFCLNMGAKVARGEYYVQLDSDDRLKPDAVEKILEVYESDPLIGMVIGSYEVWEKQADNNIKRLSDMPVVTHDEWTDENGRNNLLRINGAGAPRSIPISLIRQIGFSLNDEPYARNYGEDYAMVLNISETHRIGRVWDPIYEVIRHSGGTDHSIDQITIDRNDEAKDFMRFEAILRRAERNRNH